MIRRILALAAVVLVLLGITTAPAEATSYGRNYSASRSVVYTRHCLDYSASACALHTVAQQGRVDLVVGRPAEALR
jgi:hypothetical protein